MKEICVKRLTQSLVDFQFSKFLNSVDALHLQLYMTLSGTILKLSHYCYKLSKSTRIEVSLTLLQMRFDYDSMCVCMY